MDFLKNNSHKKQINKIDLLEKRLLFLDTENPKTETQNTPVIETDPNQNNPEENKPKDHLEVVLDQPEAKADEQEAPEFNPNLIGDSFVNDAKNTFRGIKWGEIGKNAITGRVWKAASSERRLEILVRNETETRTGLATKAIAALEGKIGFFKGKAQKRMEELNKEQIILQDLINKLERENNHTARIAELKQHRFNISKWAVHKRIKYAAHSIHEKASSAAKYVTGGLSDQDYEGKVTKDTLEAAKNLLEKNRQKQAEWESKKTESKERDQEKITTLSNVFQTKDDETKKMLGEFFDYQEESKIGDKAQNAKEMLGQFGIRNILRNIKDPDGEIMEIWNANANNRAKAIRLILGKFRNQIKPKDQKALTLIAKISEISKGDKHTETLIYDVIDGIGSATRFDLRADEIKKEKSKERDTSKEAEKKKKEIQELFLRSKNPLATGKYCRVKAGKNQQAIKDFKVTDLNGDGKNIVNSFNLFREDKDKGDIYIKIDLKTQVFQVTTYEKDDKKVQKSKGDEKTELVQSIAFLDIDDVSESLR